MAVPDTVVDSATLADLVEARDYDAASSYNFLNAELARLQAAIETGSVLRIEDEAGSFAVRTMPQLVAWVRGRFPNATFPASSPARAPRRQAELTAEDKRAAEEAKRSGDFALSVETLNELGWDHHRIQEYDGWRLLIIGDPNMLSYTHSVELVFSGVHHINCDAEFYYPTFRDLGDCPCLCESRRIGINAEPVNGPRREFEITAIQLSVNVGTVYHYHREHLGPGERNALWAQPAQ